MLVFQTRVEMAEFSSRTKYTLYIMKLPKVYDKLSHKQRKAVRAEYVRIQKNKCWYCNEDLDKRPSKEVLGKAINLSLFPEGFFKTPVHLQHDHDTGLTEGAVHAKCNAVLYQYFGR
jgi:hypothetical protein